MKKLNLNTLLFVSLFLLFGSSFSSAQTVAGKIFRSTEADSLFGPVYQFVKMPVAQFQALLDRAGSRMMFRFENSDTFIMDSVRTLIFTTGDNKEFNPSDTMKYYSKSVIKELLSKGQSSSVIIEKRQNVMSVTYDVYTMEESMPCPPACPTD